MRKQDIIKLAEIAGKAIIDLSGNRWTQVHEVTELPLVAVQGPSGPA